MRQECTLDRTPRHDAHTHIHTNNPPSRWKKLVNLNETQWDMERVCTKTVTPAQARPRSPGAVIAVNIHNTSCCGTVPPQHKAMYYKYLDDVLKTLKTLLYFLLAAAISAYEVVKEEACKCKIGAGSVRRTVLLCCDVLSCPFEAGANSSSRHYTRLHRPWSWKLYWFYCFNIPTYPL